MANNLVVQLLLKTGTFSTDLKQAGGQVQSFKSGCQSAGKSLDAFGKAIGINIGSIAKLGGAAGAAVVAFNGFKSVMMSTQTTADAFDGAIAGAKGVVEAFKVSLATADFSTFQNGLWGVFDAAKAARDAIDALNDAQWGYSMISSKNRRGFTEAQTQYKEAQAAYKNAKTKAEKDKAQADMDRLKTIMESYVTEEEKNAKNFEYKNLEAAKASVRARNTNINEKDITSDIIYRAAEIVTSINADEERKRIKEQAKTIKNEAKKYATDSKRAQYYGQKKNQDVLILDALLEMKDEQIKAVANEIRAGEEAATSASAMRKTFGRTIRGEVTPTTTPKVSSTKAQKEELQIQENSLTYWKNIVTEETKYRDALVKDTDEWKQHNDRIIEAQKHIDEINGVVKEVSNTVENSRKYYKELLSNAMEVKENSVFGSDEYRKAEKDIREIQKALTDLDLADALMIDPPTISSLEAVLSLVKKIRDELPIDSEAFKQWSTIIDDIQKKLNGAKGVKAPKTDTWESFNSAMANTATIVNALGNAFKDTTEISLSSILQMVATALPAIGSLISAINSLTAAEAVEASVGAVSKAVSTSMHWIEAISAVASLGAVVAAALSSATNVSRVASNYANGGIVPGQSFTGDRVSANVNSGEMILNRSQQARLFQIANGSPAGSNQVEFHISGTELVGVLNNQNRKNSLIR